MAQTRSGIRFGPYRLDVEAARLWKGEDPVPLQPRPLAVLSYLAERPGVVVGRDELIAKLWDGTYVIKAVLKVAVRAIREALDDDADSPRYIETVGREGYRFIGSGPEGTNDAQRVNGASVAAPMVGRERDLAALRAALARALAGSRKLVFVTGEAGIGKTTLLDRFIEEVEASGTAVVARGQCLEQYGEGEPYLPVLEAIAGLAQKDGAPELGEILQRHAPTWISQLPAFAPNRIPQPPEADAAARTPARMLREMADALEVLADRRPVVLALEDLQWCDRSTLDLIGCIARRRQPARLFLVGSLRPVDMILQDHPWRAVQHELQAKGLCDEVALELLSRDEVASYLEARFGGAPARALRRLATRVYERTEGNALFMVNMMNDFVAEGLLVRRDGQWHIDGSIDAAIDHVPHGLKSLIGQRMEGLSPPVREALETASVVGNEFAVAAVAASLRKDLDHVEDLCEQVASQRTLLDEIGVSEWPDGSVSGRYRFRHALYRQVLYEGIAEARRVRLHRAIALRQESGFGAQAGEHAAELAMHFERGRSYARALHFHGIAAAAALTRHAPHEAVAHYAAALEALDHAPKEPDPVRRELDLVVARATLLMAIQGYAATETEQAFARARVLCEALPVGPRHYPVLRGLVSFHQVRAELDEAQAFGEQLLQHAAARPDDRVLGVQAHYGHGATLFHLGAFGAARAHFETAVGAYDPAAHGEHIRTYGGYDPGVACSIWLAWTRALQGELDEAAKHGREALALARGHGEPFSLAWGHYGVGVLQGFFGDWTAAEIAYTEAARMAEEYGFPYLLAMATVNRGWALVQQGSRDTGIELLRDGVKQVERTGALLVRPSYLAMLAAADAIEGDRPAAVARVDAALAEVERTGERLHEPQLLIGKSHLLAAGGGSRPSKAETDAAETCLRRALEIAHEQGARLVALRAAVALGRHCRERGREAEAKAVVAREYEWFSSHRATTSEIVAARQLLTDLGN